MGKKHMVELLPGDEVIWKRPIPGKKNSFTKVQAVIYHMCSGGRVLLKVMDPSGTKITRLAERTQIELMTCELHPEAKSFVDKPRRPHGFRGSSGKRLRQCGSLK